jgi:hypothetical protein
MKIFFLAFFSLIVFCQVVFGQTNSQKGFAVYLLPASIKPNQLKKLDLKKLKPAGKPVIAESDIKYYQKETHEFQIDYPAADRLKKINSRGARRSFAVFVDGRAIYAGAFWKSILSQSFDGIIIDTYKAVGNPPYAWYTDSPVLTLEAGFPSVNFFKGADLRADSRILKALENAGKLYDELELVVKCKKIVGTRKRRLSHIFTFEVVKETKGKFNKKEIELELNDYQLLTELEYNEGIYAGQKVNFNQNQEIILKISQQVGQEKPDWFLRSIKKN